MHPQPQPADALDNWGEAAPNSSDLGGQKVRLLGAHPLRGGPVEAQHEGRDTGLGHDLLQNLTHRHLAVQNLVVGADDLDVHIAHGHKVPHAAGVALLHGGRPLPGDLLTAFPGQGAGQLSLAGLVHHGKAHIAAPVPVESHGVIDLHQQLRQKGHGPEQRHPVGAVGLRIERCEQQQLLSGQRLHLAPLVRTAQQKLQRRRPLPDLQVLHPAAQQRGDVATVQVGHDLAHRPAADQKGVHIAVQKGVDAELSPAHRHGPQEFLQSRLRAPVLAGGGDTAHHAHDLVDGRVHHRHSLPDSPVDLDLSAPQGHIPVQHPKGLPVHRPQLHRLCSGRLGLFPSENVHVFLLAGLFRPFFRPCRLPTAPQRWRQNRRSAVPPPWPRNSAYRPWRGRSPFWGHPVRPWGPSSTMPSPAGNPCTPGR